MTKSLTSIDIESTIETNPDNYVLLTKPLKASATLLNDILTSTVFNNDLKMNI